MPRSVHYAPFPHAHRPSGLSRQHSIILEEDDARDRLRARHDSNPSSTSTSRFKSRFTPRARVVSAPPSTTQLHLSPTPSPSSSSIFTTSSGAGASCSTSISGATNFASATASATVSASETASAPLITPRSTSLSTESSSFTSSTSSTTSTADTDHRVVARSDLSCPSLALARQWSSYYYTTYATHLVLLAQTLLIILLAYHPTMPSFFSNIPGISNIPNPLNIFNPNNPPSDSNSPTPTPTSPTNNNSLFSRARLGSSTSPSPGPPKPKTAEAGPGPSTTAAAAKGALAPAPTRPSLRPNESSSGSLVDPLQTRRKSSGTSVAIAADDDHDRESRPSSRLGEVKRRARAQSAVSGISGVSGVGSGRKRKMGPVETFVIVKPPSTASKNPLNLQVQLVMNTGKGNGRQRSQSGMSTSSSSAGLSIPNTPVRLSADLPRDESSNNVVDISHDLGAPLTASTVGPDDTLQTPTTGDGLKRSSSMQSTSSTRSSISTSASATSSTASGKRIVPLYNLAVHNVMQPTAVTDAGTDVKVAKFLKRTLDISGVGILEPSEILYPNPNPSLSGSPQWSDNGHDFGGRRGSSRPQSMIYTAPLSPAVSSTAGDIESKRSSLDFKSFKVDGLLSATRSGGSGASGSAGEDENGPKKFFGKIFKKRSSAEALVPPPQHRRSPSKAVSPEGNGSKPAPPAPSLHVKAPSVPVGHASVDLSSYGAPTFGLSPSVVVRRGCEALIDPNGAIIGLSSAFPVTAILDPTLPQIEMFPFVYSSRPVGYTWTVRKWAKKNTEGWASHLIAAAQAGLDLNGGPSVAEGDEVVFEWIKLRTPSGPVAGAAGGDISRRYSISGGGPRTAATTRNRSRPGSIAPGATIGLDDSPSGSRTSLTLRPPSRRSASPLPPATATIPSPNPGLDPRPGPVRRASASASPSPRRASSAVGSDNGDAASLTGIPSEFGGNGNGGNAGLGLQPTPDEDDSDPEDSETPWACSVWVKRTGHRQLLATLKPAPHHPKVIGVLSIPEAMETVALAAPRVPTGIPGSRSSQTLSAPFSGLAGNGRRAMDRREAAAEMVRQEVALTEENLKDIVCVTAMWLVAREEFAGFGKKRKA